MPRLRPHHLLALVPPLAILLGVPFANGVRLDVLGMPFLLFWILACVVATSAVMAIVGALDRRDAARGPRPEPGARGPEERRP